MTDIALVPGFWLGGWAWDRVSPHLREAGHRVWPVTLPGLESSGAARAGIRLTDHVAAVVDLLIANDLHDVVLVGHSGAGTVVYGAVDRIPERIARHVYVDSGPLADGVALLPDLPAAPAVTEIPLPGWSELEAQGSSLAGLSQADRDEFARRAIPHPAGPARDPARLVNPGRRLVPAAVVASSSPAEQVRRLATAGAPFFAELAALEVAYVDLPTGHWPMFSRPAELAAILRLVAEGVAAPQPVRR